MAEKEDKEDKFIEMLLLLKNGTEEEKEMAMDKLFEMEVERMERMERLKREEERLTMQKGSQGFTQEQIDEMLSKPVEEWVLNKELKTAIEGASENGSRPLGTPFREENYNGFNEKCLQDDSKG